MKTEPETLRIPNRLGDQMESFDITFTNPHNINGAKLLDEISSFIRQFVSLASPQQADVVALQVIHTHAIAARHRRDAPTLPLTPAEKRSGKDSTTGSAEPVGTKSLVYRTNQRGSARSQNP